MKKITLVFILATISLVNLSAQIYVNTGNPNVQKAKKENPNAVVVDVDKSVKPTETGIAPATAKTVTATKSTAPVKSTVSTDIPADLPLNAEPGKCYARTAIPDKYETIEEQVIDKPASFRTEVIPAKYKTVYDSVITKPATVKKITTPAVYETITEDVLVTPATQKWVSVSDPTCLSPNPSDCQILQLKEIPAVYKKTTRREIKTPASVQEIPVPAVYSVTKRSVVEVPAQTTKIEIPATYKKITRQQLVSKGGYSQWQEVLCGKDLTPEKIKAIQIALTAEGFDVGTPDGYLGERSRAAILRYQQAKGLPVGNLNIATLQKLGVK